MYHTVTLLCYSQNLLADSGLLGATVDPTDPDLRETWRRQWAEAEAEANGEGAEAGAEARGLSDASGAGTSTREAEEATGSKVEVEGRVLVTKGDTDVLERRWLFSSQQLRLSLAQVGVGERASKGQVKGCIRRAGESRLFVNSGRQSPPSLMPADGGVRGPQPRGRGPRRGLHGQFQLKCGGKCGRANVHISAHSSKQ